MSGGLVT